ncbi:MAG: hypothetical protein IPJ49_18770 [Candidatus Obscuribacter sp.]|nr:hypothetical protein [Candidatus Obscuribacter sp.]
MVRPIAPEDLDTRLTKPPEPVEAEDTEPAKITEASFFAGKSKKLALNTMNLDFPQNKVVAHLALSTLLIQAILAPPVVALAVAPQAMAV